jgi:hypothetical protein
LYKAGYFDDHLTQITNEIYHLKDRKTTILRLFGKLYTDRKDSDQSCMHNRHALIYTVCLEATRPRMAQPKNISYDLLFLTVAEACLLKASDMQYNTNNIERATESNSDESAIMIILC